jgi:hypothetical protein
MHQTEASSRRGRFIRAPRPAEEEVSEAKTPLMLGPSNSPSAGVPKMRAPVRSTPAWERYPKFQGGFHSRQLQDLGVPTGDQGLRGNGFSIYPW